MSDSDFSPEDYEVPNFGDLTRPSKPSSPVPPPGHGSATSQSAAIEESSLPPEISTEPFATKPADVSPTSTGAQPALSGSASMLANGAFQPTDHKPDLPQAGTPSTPQIPHLAKAPVDDRLEAQGLPPAPVSAFSTGPSKDFALGKAIVPKLLAQAEQLLNLAWVISLAAHDESLITQTENACRALHKAQIGIKEGNA